MKDIFNIENFNIIEDEENYYFLRALNMADNQDLEQGKIILRNSGNIFRGRTDPAFESDDGIVHKMGGPSKNSQALENEKTLDDTLGAEASKTFKNNPSIPKNEIIIFNLHTSPYSSLVIQNRPTEVQVNPTSSWVAVRSMGRNNPFYMYTGGEDTLSFEISWYVNDPSHIEEVVAKCRILESWSKADAYNQAPPTLKISWGNSNLFGNYDWILESCPYRLTNFQNASRGHISRINSADIIDKQLYPACAIQTLTFKKVTFDNSTWVSQIGMPVKGIRGVNDSKYTF